MYSTFNRFWIGAVAVVLRPRTIEQILSRSSHENVVVIVYAETQWRRYPAFCSRGKTYHVEWLQTSDHPAPAQPSPPRRDPAWSPNKAASSSQHSPAQTVPSLPCCSSLSCWKDGPARRCPVKECYVRLCRKVLPKRMT